MSVFSEYFNECMSKCLQGGVNITHIESDSYIYGILSAQEPGHGLCILILPQCIVGPSLVHLQFPLFLRLIHH